MSLGLLFVTGVLFLISGVCGVAVKHDPFLKLYIVEIPERFLTESSDNRRSFGSLGPTLANASEDLWITRWHQMDNWFYHQLSISQLRTYDIESADLVVVPVAPRIKSYNTTFRAFMQQAAWLLPLLGSKPHVIVLNHPAHIYDQLAPGVLGSLTARNFTFLAIQADPNPGHAANTKRDNSNFVVTPYMTQIHWHRGHRAIRESQQATIDPSTVQQRKQKLASFSAKVRHFPQRFRIHADCIARPDLCTFVNWTSDAQSLQQSVTAMRSSWYTFQGPADFAVRSMLYQSILSTSIPVFTGKQVLQHLPFTDILNYTSFTTTLDGSISGGFMDPIAAIGKQNVLDLLNKQFDSSKALQMLQELHDVRHVMQFSLNPDHDRIRFDQMWELTSEDDAFTFSMKALMRNLCRRGLLLRQRCMSGYQPPGARHQHSRNY